MKEDDTEIGPNTPPPQVTQGALITNTGEQHVTAAAAHAAALVQAAFVMAERRPRNILQVRSKLLQACQRTTFAKGAWYKKPVGRERDPKTGKWGDKIAEGLNIRFAEEAARLMGNLRIESITTYDDDEKRVSRFVTMDLETNTEWGSTVTIPKETERRELRQGQVALRTRTNSYNERVFIVRATAEETHKQEGAERSKVLRDQILRLVPADVKEDCIAEIKKTQLADVKADPKAAIKQIVDSFMEINIDPKALTEYVGHDLELLTPEEVVDLRGVHAALKEGEVNWRELLDQRREGEADAKAQTQGGQTGQQQAQAGTTTQASPALSSVAQRKAIELTARKKKIDLLNICEKFNKQTLDELTYPEAEEAKRFLAGIPDA
jgi:hypothetical protein